MRRLNPPKLLLSIVIFLLLGFAGVWWAGTRAAQNPAADINHDGVINIFDLSTLLSHWNISGSGIVGDINADNTVNIFDLSVLLASWGAVSATPTPPVSCGGPITITTGGTYSGCYESNDTAVPAVRINTTQPVTLNHAHIRHKGLGITDGVNCCRLTGVNLTVTNSKFLALESGGVFEQRDIDLWTPGSLVAEHNSLIDGHGIYLAAGTASPIRIRYNEVRNIGRYPFPTDSNCCRQFVQLNGITSGGIEIAWNRVRNTYGQSQVEDNINMYKTSGTATNPIDIHHNLIDGSFPRTGNGIDHTGSGILLGDGNSAGTGNYGQVHHNRVINIANVGVSVSGGHDNHLYNNRLVSDGKADNGTTVASSFGQSMNVWDSYNANSMTNANAYDNVSGWVRPDGRADGWLPGCNPAGSCTGNTLLPSPITSATEQAERDGWAADLVSASLTVGPDW